MKIIGLTGRSGSGKSTVSAILRKMGYPVADSDLVARQVLQAGSVCTGQIADAFGQDILDEAGNVKRQLLAQRAFATPATQQTLVAITHPEIVARLLSAAQQAKQQGATLFFVDGAVIVGAPFEKECDAILLVTADEDKSIVRICARDGISQEMAETRLNAQLSNDTLRKVAVFEIENTGDKAALKRQVRQALTILKDGDET